jgi:hypothetical protein
MMFTHSSVLPNIGVHLLLAAAALTFFAAVGRLLNGNRLHGAEPFERLIGMMVFGLLFSVGLGVTLVFRRIGVHTLVPIILGVAAITAHRRMAATTVVGGWRSYLPSWLAVVFVLLICWVLNAWNRDLVADKGFMRMGHGDLGYFALLAKELPEARVSHHWTAVVGSALADEGLARDQWYHWGPIWLGMLIRTVTGLPALESVINVGEIVMMTLMILLAACIVRALTKWRLFGSVLMAMGAFVIMPFPQHFRPFIVKLLPFGWLQHCRNNVLWQFSYLFEAIQIMFIMLCWLSGRKKLALLMVLCATISSPHFVCGAGVAAGALMVFGFIMRDRSLWQPAAALVGTILFGWALLQWGLGIEMATGLSRQSGEGLFGFSWRALVTQGERIVTDVGIELILGVLLVPGWIALIKIKEQSLPSEARFLGWLAIAGLCGGTAAFHLFQHEEKFHFMDFPMLLLATPTAAFGLALWISRVKGWQRLAPILVLSIGLGFGAEDLFLRKYSGNVIQITPRQMDAVKDELRGQPYGYFTTKDRPWWIPRRAYMAAVLDSRCIRLNPVISADVSNRFSRFYNSFELMSLVPYGEGEPLPPWSLKVMKRLGIQYILKAPGDPVPAEIESICDKVVESQGITLLKLKTHELKEPEVTGGSK